MSGYLEFADALVAMSGRIVCEPCLFDATYPVAPTGWPDVAEHDMAEHAATVMAYMTLACRHCRWHCEFEMDVDRDPFGALRGMKVPNLASFTFYQHIEGAHPALLRPPTPKRMLKRPFSNP